MMTSGSEVSSVRGKNVYVQFETKISYNMIINIVSFGDFFVGSSGRFNGMSAFKWYMRQ